MITRKECKENAEKLVSQMSIAEAASQLLHQSPAIERLNIPEYNWWSEGLHGVARAGIATVFPQAIGMAAAFDDSFLCNEAKVISEEARAKYNAAVRHDDHDIYKGLTYWSPNINIFRDPRWGRGHETYGEDPYLTEKLGDAFIEGLQQKDENGYLKIAACAKHFAVHSGPEAIRHGFDVSPTEKDLNETYLPAFESAVKDKKVEAVMTAYNSVFGEPCCANDRLINKILKDEWGFEGHIVSDCWAVKDMHGDHHFTKTPEESAALAVRRGCDLNCGCTFEYLLMALDQGLITEEEIRTAAVHVFTTRFM
nr:glycoside hydrolase family 3 protein [Lachnospiraceae bacterium]